VPNPDPLAAAKATLASANKFQNSAGGALPSKPAPAAAASPAPKEKTPTLGDELEAKRANVDSYRKAYVENYKARNQ